MMRAIAVPARRWIVDCIVHIMIRNSTVMLSLPLFGFVVATRGALGVGIGLLLAGKLSPERRRALGRTLIAIGVATTIPAAMAVFGSREPRQLAVAADRG